MKRQTIVEIVTDNGKEVSAVLRRDLYGDISITSLTIGKNYYSGKRIRTAVREQKIVAYLSNRIDLNEYFIND